MMKTLLITLLFYTTTLTAQTIVSGTVLSAGGDTLAGANAFIKDALDGGSSDAYGKFSFKTDETGNKTLIVMMMGFEPYQKEISLEGAPVKVKVVLKEKISELNTVTISAGNFETGDAKKMSVLNSIEIATTAGATADVFGALKTLPSSQPAAEADGLFVRGGDAYESKTFFDGILVKNLYVGDLPDIAQRGRFSPFMFKGTSFSTGAYSAQYGEALSSTVSFESKDVSPKTKSDIGIMSVGLDASHIHRFKNSSLDLNGSYYNLEPAFSVVKQNTKWTKKPEQFHSNAFYKLNTGSNGQLKMYVNYSHSNVGIMGVDFNDIRNEVSYRINNDNLYANTSWQQFIGTMWKINLGAGYGLDQNNIGIDTNKVKQTERSLHARAMVTRYYGQLSDVKAGIEYFNFSNEESYNRLSHKLEGPLAASFIETNFYITNKLAIRTGVRQEYAAINAANNLAPRISLAWKWSNLSQVAFGYGKFYQLPKDEFLFTSTDLMFENATHYVFNYQYQKEKRTFRAEAYYKQYDQLVKENSLVPSGLDNSGDGYSKGLDIYYRDTKTIRNADYWISYSLLDTKRNYRNYPIAAVPTFAARHVLNLVGKYHITKWDTRIGATYTYASGRTYYNPNNPDFLSDRTKDYHNFSMNVSYLTSIAKQFTIVYVSLENILGIDQVFGYRYSPDGSVRKPIVPSAKRNIFIGVFITFGDNSFK